MTALQFSGEVWMPPGDSSFYFVTVPEDPSDVIRIESGPRVGFGSVRVQVTVGDTSWSTSVFPQSSGTYVLPLKRHVRDAEGILPGDIIRVTLRLAAA